MREKERSALGDAYRRLRNIGSHPSFQTLQTPGDALHASM
jgi:hypothetical protein